VSKYNPVKRHFFAVLLFCLTVLQAGAQGTAFSYQGKLNDGGSPATGSYDLRFAVFSAVTNGIQNSAYLTNTATGVSNGLFSVTLDFGAGIFTGSNYWLDVSVRTNGGAGFTALVPRQPILPVPYAIFANSASNLLGVLTAAQFSGNLPASQVAGGSTNTVNFTNLNNLFSGTFTGGGASLSNLNASQLTTGTVADTRLSANVPLLNANQTFTGANEFDGANTFSNWNNSFTGSFFGNGLVGWIVTNSATVQAARDHGYTLAAPVLTTVTLPANASLTNGDIVRISGAGGGGWLVKPNSGQSITGNFAAYTNAVVTKRTKLTSATTLGVAASADGALIYAVGNDLTGVWGSTDAGDNWSQLNNTTLPAGSYQSVACSANGRIVYAEPASSGNIQKSTDAGANWTDTGIGRSGQFIACTADGGTLFSTNVACSGNGTYRARLSGSTITISTNSGASWGVSVTAPAAGVSCLAASGDCTRLVAGTSSGMLYATANQGANWTALTISNQVWSAVWLSADGSHLAGAVNGSGGVFSAAVSPLPETTTTNSIAGSRGSAVELQYLGSGQFMPVSSTGLIWAN
jgi:hypothetical protein